MHVCARVIVCAACAWLSVGLLTEAQQVFLPRACLLGDMQLHKATLQGLYLLQTLALRKLSTLRRAQHLDLLILLPLLLFLAFLLGTADRC